MSGYAARTHPSEGVLSPLWAKALAIESSPGARIVIVTTDLVGIPRELSDEVAAKLKKQYGLKRSQFLINASHTHTGPIVWPNLRNLTVLPPGEQEKLMDYRNTLAAALVSVVGVRAARPLARRDRIRRRRGGFRRQSPRGHQSEWSGGSSRAGPEDRRSGGQDSRILFGYACHNTTLTGEFYQLSGDYAGFAAETSSSAIPARPRCS